VREARSDITDSLEEETYGHINSAAGCKGIATTGTTARHSIWRHLYDSMHASQKLKSKLKFVTLDKERLRQPKEFLSICSMQNLAEKAQKINLKMTMPVKKSQETRYNLDPVSFFWGSRLDGVETMTLC